MDKVVSELKARLRVIDAKVERTLAEQQRYARRMAYFGAAAWAFGVSVLASTFLVFAPALATAKTAVACLPLAVFALAAPIAVAAAFVRRYDVAARRLRARRARLWHEYQMIVLREVERALLGHGGRAYCPSKGK